jgi:hypothetical protein
MMMFPLMILGVQHWARQQQIQRHQRQQLLDKNQVKLILEMEQQLMG